MIGRYMYHMVGKTTNNKLEIIGLYRSDYLAQFHIREIAKQLKKSHVTLLPHIKDLEQEKVLIPKKIGKNKSYFINLDNIVAKKYLLLSETNKSIAYLDKIFLIKKIYSEVFNLNLNGIVILFGSYAKKSHNSDSDIDIIYLGKIKHSEINNIKKIGKTYGKVINIKKATIQSFQRGIKKKDNLIIEIIKDHIVLQGTEAFTNILWRHYNETKH